jgi:hypothetical protein
MESGEDELQFMTWTPPIVRTASKQSDQPVSQTAVEQDGIDVRRLLCSPSGRFAGAATCWIGVGKATQG